MRKILISAVAAAASLLSSAAFARDFYCTANTYEDGSNWSYEFQGNVDHWGNGHAYMTVRQNGHVVVHNAPAHAADVSGDTTDFSVDGSVYGLSVWYNRDRGTILVKHNITQWNQISAMGECNGGRY